VKTLILGLALAALLAGPSSSQAQLFRRRPRVIVARPRVVVVQTRRFVAVAPARRFAVRPRVGFVQPRRFARGF
jgi:hypothetical protein